MKVNYKHDTFNYVKYDSQNFCRLVKFLQKNIHGFVWAVHPIDKPVYKLNMF